MAKARMNVEEVMSDMRKRGMSISYYTFVDGIEKGMFPFVRSLGVNSNGRRKQIILRTEYEKWADEKIGGLL